MSLESRFRQLNAPHEFSADLGVPLRWRGLEDRPDVVAIFDPGGSTGFVLRVFSDAPGDSALDVAFHLDGRIARMLTGRQAILESHVQEAQLSKLFPH